MLVSHHLSQGLGSRHLDLFAACWHPLPLLLLIHCLWQGLGFCHQYLFVACWHPLPLLPLSHRLWQTLGFRHLHLFAACWHFLGLSQIHRRCLDKKHFPTDLLPCHASLSGLPQFGKCHLALPAECLYWSHLSHFRENWSSRQLDHTQDWAWRNLPACLRLGNGGRWCCQHCALRIRFGSSPCRSLIASKGKFPEASLAKPTSPA